MACLATPLRKENDILTATRKAFGKLDRKPVSLENRLQQLTEQELYLVLQFAQFVKLAHGFGQRSTHPYIQLVRQMYPKISFNLQNIIADLLQDAEPIKEQKVKPKETTAQNKDYTDELLAEYRPSPISEEELPFIIREGKLVRNKDVNSLDFLKEEGRPLDLPGTPLKDYKQGNNIDFSKRVTVDDDGQFKSKQAFINALQPIAEDVGTELGIDPKIVMAQAILETGYGAKVRGFNYFGIKSHGKSNGQTFTTHEKVEGLMQKQKDSFRKYDSLEDSVRDYGLFLQQNKRYRPLLEADTLDDQIDALAKSGYATDTRYGDKIRGIIKGKTFKELLG